MSSVSLIMTKRAVFLSPSVSSSISSVSISPAVIAGKLSALPVKSSFGWGIRGASKITVKLIFDTVGLHGEKHHQGVMESHLPVPGEVPAGVDGILLGVSGNFIDCRQEQSKFFCVRGGKKQISDL